MEWCQKQTIIMSTITIKYYIRKLYLGLIHLIDLGSTWSTLIYLGMLLIYLQVPQLALGLLRFKPKPAFRSGSMSEYSDRIWIFVWVLRPDLPSFWSMPKLVYWSKSLSEYSDWILSSSDLCPSQLPDLNVFLSTRTRSCLTLIHVQARYQIYIFI